jgi:hypothetical protein
MDPKLIAIVAAFTAEALIDHGAVPKPKNEEEVMALLKECSLNFLLFLLEGGPRRATAPVPAHAGEESCECETCPDRLTCPGSTSRN